MDAFATVKDLESRWRAMDSSEEKRAEVLLEDAAAMIAAEMERFGIAVDDKDEKQARNLVRVSCDMVLRVMDPEAPQEAWGVGSVVPRHNELFITKQERNSIVNRRGRIGFASMLGAVE